MSFEEFRASLDRGQPPPGLDRAARALWLDGRGDWAQAHECAQEEPGPDGSWVHAYLHRKEGDDANAGYWYRRAGRTPPETDLATEWEAIARELLSRRRPTVRSG